MLQADSACLSSGDWDDGRVRIVSQGRVDKEGEYGALEQLKRIEQVVRFVRSPRVRSIIAGQPIL